MFCSRDPACSCVMPRDNVKEKLAAPADVRDTRRGGVSARVGTAAPPCLMTNGSGVGTSSGRRSSVTRPDSGERREVRDSHRDITRLGWGETQGYCVQAQQREQRQRTLCCTVASAYAPRLAARQRKYVPSYCSVYELYVNRARESAKGTTKSAPIRSAPQWRIWRYEPAGIPCLQTDAVWRGINQRQASMA